MLTLKIFCEIIAAKFDRSLSYGERKTLQQRREIVESRLVRCLSKFTPRSSTRPAVNGPRHGWWFASKDAGIYGYQLIIVRFLDNTFVEAWAHKYTPLQSKLSKVSTFAEKAEQMIIWQYVLTEIDKDGKRTQILDNGMRLGGMTDMSVCAAVIVEYCRKPGNDQVNPDTLRCDVVQFRN